MARRGNAWFTFGIIEYLQASKATLPQAIVTYIQDTYLAQVDQLIKLQDASSGLWHTVLDDPTSYLEVSGSAGIANAVDETGTLTGVSAGTGIGMDAQHYKDIIIAPMAYGQSLGLLALTESLYFL